MNYNEIERPLPTRSQPQIDLKIGNDSVQSAYTEIKTKKKLKIYPEIGTDQPIILLSKDIPIKVSKNPDMNGDERWVRVQTPDIKGWSMLDAIKMINARKTERSHDARAKKSTSPNANQRSSVSLGNSSLVRASSRSLGRFTAPKEKIYVDFRTVAIEIALREGPGHNFDSVAVIPCGALIMCSALRSAGLDWIKARYKPE